MYEQDARTVLTLDAGGTNLVFSAMRGCREITRPIRIKTVTDDTNRCLETLVEGFRAVEAAIDAPPVAISFAFPGPADYAAGIIGDLPNFPCFRGGVAMGPYLEDVFNLPVFINNDGNLFAYGEALAGTLPSINKALEEAGNPMRHKNMIGLTFGTGFGCGVVIDGRLLTGDNGCGGDVWLMRNVSHPDLIAEEGVSIRAVKREYAERSGDDRPLSPKDVFDIAEGFYQGDRQAAIDTFAEMGRVAADAAAHVLDVVDGLIVLGGGLSGASKYIIPEMIRTLRPWLQMEVYDLTLSEGIESFLKDGSTKVKVPSSDREVIYRKEKKTGIAVTTLGTEKAVSIGAYTFALSCLDRG